MQFLIIVGVLMNLVMIGRAIYNKNFPYLSLFVFWFFMFTIPSILIGHRFVIENSDYISYFVYHFSKVSFMFSVFLQDLTLVVFFIFSKLQLKKLKIKSMHVCSNFSTKKIILITIMFCLMSFIFFLNLGGIQSLINMSRPGLVSGSMTFLIFFSSIKYFFIISVINQSWYRYVFFPMLLSSIIFIALLSKIYLLIFMFNIMYFYWFYMLKRYNINNFNKLFFGMVIMSFVLTFLAILKFSDDSMNLIIENGFIYFVDKQFDGSILNFFDLYYEIGIESTSILANFIEVYGFTFVPNFFLPVLSSFLLFLPSILRSYFGEFSHFMAQFSHIEAIVPNVFVQFFEAYNFVGPLLYPFFIIYIYYFSTRNILSASRVFPLFVYISLLSNSILLVRGTMDTFIGFIFYDFLGIGLAYLLLKLKWSS